MGRPYEKIDRLLLFVTVSVKVHPGSFRGRVLLEGRMAGNVLASKPYLLLMWFGL